MTNSGKYVPKVLKSKTIGVYKNVEIGPSPTVCAMMCSNLYDMKKGWDLKLNFSAALRPTYS